MPRIWSSIILRQTPQAPLLNCWLTTRTSLSTTVQVTSRTYHGKTDSYTWKDGYFDSETRKIVDSYGYAAEKVVFGDKTTAGIDGITTDADAEVIGIYDAQGRKLEEMQQGINIIRMSDGTTRKVIRK